MGSSLQRLASTLRSGSTSDTEGLIYFFRATVGGHPKPPEDGLDYDPSKTMIEMFTAGDGSLIPFHQRKCRKHNQTWMKLHYFYTPDSPTITALVAKFIVLKEIPWTTFLICSNQTFCVSRTHLPVPVDTLQYYFQNLEGVDAGPSVQPGVTYHDMTNEEWFDDGESTVSKYFAQFDTMLATLGTAVTLVDDKVNRLDVKVSKGLSIMTKELSNVKENVMEVELKMVSTVCYPGDGTVVSFFSRFSSKLDNLKTMVDNLDGKLHTEGSGSGDEKY